jgi:hypothetical protein
MVRGDAIFDAANAEMVGIAFKANDGKWKFNRAWDDRLPEKRPGEPFYRPGKP